MCSDHTAAYATTVVEKWNDPPHKRIAFFEILASLFGCSAGKAAWQAKVPHTLGLTRPPYTLTKINQTRPIRQLHLHIETLFYIKEQRK
jgi:hypothetical protein